MMVFKQIFTTLTTISYQLLPYVANQDNNTVEWKLFRLLVIY